MKFGVTETWEEPVKYDVSVQMPELLDIGVLRSAGPQPGEAIMPDGLEDSTAQAKGEEGAAASWGGSMVVSYPIDHPPSIEGTIATGPGRWYFDDASADSTCPWYVIYTTRPHNTQPHPEVDIPVKRLVEGNAVPLLATRVSLLGLTLINSTR